jgi:fucose 4-O-acetylase-like acetyltransferase
VGEWLEGVRTAPEEPRATWQLGALGGALVAIGYAATFFPPVYDNNALWTVAPSFVGLRLGILLLALPVALALALRRRAHSVLEEFGVSSLFVYWIHVEMVYGIPSMSLHRKLTVPQAALGYVLLCVFLFALVRLKNRLGAGLKTGGYVRPSSVRQTSG